MKASIESDLSKTQTVSSSSLESLSALLYSLVPLTKEEIEAAPALNEENADRVIRDLHARQPGLAEFFPAEEGISLEEITENSRGWDAARRIAWALEIRFGWVPVLAAEELRSVQKKAQELLADPVVRAQVERLPVYEVAHATFKNDPPDSQQAGKLARVLIGVLAVLMCYSAAYARATEVTTNQRAAAELDTTPEALTSTIDSLISIPGEELLAAFARSDSWSEAVARLAARSFREGQPGIYRYIPYTVYTPEDEAEENGGLCACTRRICLALANQFGWVPVLKINDLKSAEGVAQAMLADPSLRAKVERLPIMRLLEMKAEPGSEEAQIDPSRHERAKQKLLTIWICFARAYGPACEGRASNPKSEASAAAIPILSPNEFTQELAAALRKLGPHLNPKVTKHLEMVLTLRGGHQMTIGTFGLYNRYLVTPQLKDEIIAKFCTIALSAAGGVGFGSGPMEE